MIPKQLITQLTSGRCFALIGSGPSIVMGYPSWTKLAQCAIELLPASRHHPARGVSGISGESLTERHAVSLR